MLVLFSDEVSRLGISYVDRLLADYKKDPRTNWKSKDAACNLVLALGIKGQTRRGEFPSWCTGV